MPQLTMVEALNLALDQSMKSDDRVCLLGEDIGVNGGVFRVTKGLQHKYGEARVMDTPLAENAIIGTAVVQQPEDLKLPRLEVVRGVCLPQAAHRHLAEQREQ